MSYPRNQLLGDTDVFSYFADVTTGTPAAYIAAVKSGRVIQIAAVQQSGTLAGSDTVLTAKINGVAITNGTLTLSSGGTAGTVTDTDLRSLSDGTNRLSEGASISFVSDGGSNDSTVPFMVQATIRH